MSYHSKGRIARALTMLPAMIAVLFTFATFAAAQSQPAPKWEVYGGYSFLDPKANVHGTLPQGLVPLSSGLDPNTRGAGAAVTYDFNRWFGLTLDASDNWGDGTKTLHDRIDDTGFSNLSIGPKFTLRSHHFAPFLEGLVGDHRLMPEAFHNVNKLGFMVGGGLDINLTRHVALRLIRADYVISDYRFTTTPSTDFRAVRLQSGLNFMFGGGAPAMAPSAACSVQPTEVFAGEPVTASATGSNFNPKRTVRYKWSGTGVKVAGSDASTQIDTTGLLPGSYQVTANLNDGSKHGFASSSAKFTVKEPHPPVISCSPDPASVRIGGTSTIHSNASSPDARKLTQSYTATSGDISGNGDSATLNARDTQPGNITVTCNVSDDRNPPLTATTTTMVNVQAPPPPAPEIKELETKLALHSIYFPTARPTAKNPEGGLVASQAEILTNLAADFAAYLKYSPNAHLIFTGYADSRGTEEYNKALTQRRVERTTRFLVEHGVPADHMETRSLGKDKQLTADEIQGQIEQNTDLSPDNKQQMLKNLQVLVLANNRRVDVTLSTTGEQSIHRYPFNAKDFLSLINTKNVEKKPAVKKKP